MEQTRTNQDRTHLERMINMLSDNLHVYEEQAAAFGELYVPPFLVRQINETKSEISKIQEQLSQYKSASTQEENIIPKVPHNLPSQAQLVDRCDELTALTTALNDPSIITVIIEGLTGTGKTALACNLANNMWLTGKHKGAVWASAENSNLTINSLIDTLATILDYPNLIRLGGEEKKLAAAKILRAQSILLILDGYEKVENDAEIIDFLLRIPSPSKVIITRNKRGDNFSNSYVLSLKGLEPQDSIDLILHECNRLNIKGAERLPEKTLKQLHELTSGNPYAIKLSIGQIKRFGLTFDSILSRLNSAQGQLFEHIYDNSWKSLKDEQRLILKAIAVLGGSTSLLTLQEITKMQFWNLESNLAELIEMSLVETNLELEREKIRYGILSLTRTYVLNSLQDENKLKNALISRASDYYLEFCNKHKNFLGALQKELENLRIVMEWCRDERQDSYVQFTRLLYPFFRDVGYWQDAIVDISFAIEITKGGGQKLELGWLYCELASIHIRVGGQKELASASLALEDAQEIFEANNNLEGLCAVYGRQARIAHKRKDYQIALSLGVNALNLAKEKNLISRIADIQHEIGDTYRLVGDLDAAKAHYEESLKIYQSANDTVRVAGRLNDLGYLALQGKRIMEAKSFFLDSIALCEQHDKKDTLTRALNGLALVENQLNFPLKSYHSALRARQIATRLGATYENQQASELESKALENLSHQTVWIFNFNNTLADTYTLNVEAWVLACHYFGFDVPVLALEEELKMGADSKQIIKRMGGIGPDKEGEVVKLKRSIFRDNALKELRLYPDVKETFRALKQRANLIAIFSMMPEAIILETLKRAQLSEFVDKIVGIETLPNGQSNTSAKLRACEIILEYIPLDKDRFIIVGDSQEENDASRRYAIKYIHFSRFAIQSPTGKYPGTYRCINSLSEVLTVE